MCIFRGVYCGVVYSIAAELTGTTIANMFCMPISYQQVALLICKYVLYAYQLSASRLTNMYIVARPSAGTVLISKLFMIFASFRGITFVGLMPSFKMVDEILQNTAILWV